MGYIICSRGCGSYPSSTNLSQKLLLWDYVQNVCLWKEYWHDLINWTMAKAWKTSEDTNKIDHTWRRDTEQVFLYHLMVQTYFFREFAIVILSAFCLASEPMSYVVAVETDLINHLISFIEYHDQAMHQVMQTHGMATLRDNPELMGTSIGMLRRAATLLRHFSKIPETRKTFLRNTARLLQFTMSQLVRVFNNIL